MGSTVSKMIQPPSDFDTTSQRRKTVHAWPKNRTCMFLNTADLEERTYLDKKAGYESTRDAALLEWRW